nr:immunoglobulin heavy chain junction region [Mus musculus]
CVRQNWGYYAMDYW